MVYAAEEVHVLSTCIYNKLEDCTTLKSLLKKNFFFKFSLPRPRYSFSFVYISSVFTYSMLTGNF